MKRPLPAILALSSLALMPRAAPAQTSRSVTDGYEDLIKAAQTVSAIGPDLFGEQVNLQDGATAFKVTDLAVKLNSGLPMGIGRKLGINARDFDRYSDVAADGELFGNWQLDVPYMHGTFDERTGWISSMANGQQRCSVTSVGALAPPTRPSIFKTYNSYEPSQYWSGNHINIPGAGEEPLLYLPPEGARPSDGKTYHGATRSSWRVSCLPTLLNGAGEGFLVVLPDGTRYTFNWMSSRRVSSIKEVACNRYGCPEGIGLNRREYFLSATRVEDRLGNWVAYTYDPANPRRLTAVTSSEGASIALSYTGNGKISAISSHGRTWTFAYGDAGNTTLASVTQPDGSRWSYAYDNIFQVTRSDAGLLWRDCNPPVSDQTSPPPAGQILTITHPSGAIGTFKFRRLVHGTENTPGICYDPDPDVFGDEQVSSTAAAYRIASLYAKSISGPGLSAQEWRYLYSPSWSWAQECSPTVCPATSTSQTAVTGPDGTITRYTFGNNYQTNAGQLLAVATESAGATLRQASNAYLTTAAGQPFPDAAGLDPQRFTNHLVTEKNRPLRSSTQVQEGVTFSRYVNTFDSFARPLSVAASSTLGFSRTDVTEYADHLALWVLGAVQRIYNVESGVVKSQTDHDALARPWKVYAFGKLQQTFTYNSDGTLATVKDGNGNVTTVSGWKRGVPQLITYPATAEAPSGATQSAVVDDSGWVTSVTDEHGTSTSYAHDAMGRLSGITYPSNDSVAWSPRWVAFRPLTAADWLPPGVVAGQWRQTISEGNYAKVTYFDAQWRPVLVHEYDALSFASTLRAVRTTYDSQGRVIFQSYPSSSAAPESTGTRTVYDALDRPVRSEQDSEHGILVTTTAYLPGLQRRVTNPRGFQSTTAYAAWDEPAYDLPLWSTQPEGKVVEITRHPQLGWPQQLKQRSADGAVAQVRSYVYDGAGKVCKTIDPETGATVQGYDDSGNPIWSAAGLTGGTYAATSTCSQAEAWNSGRRVVRTFDARNRMLQLRFPDGRGDQQWTYERDGLPSTITAWNEAASGAPVITAYSYNKRRLVTAESVQQPGWYTWALSYGYDSIGNLRSQAYPTGLTVELAPNSLGQPTRAGTYATGASYYPNGAIKQFTYGNGVVHTMTQNARQLPARVSSSGGALDFSYGYDHNGNVASIWDHVRDTGDGTYGRWMTYDGLDRLTSAGSCSFGGDCWHQFSYDALDNLRSWKLGGVKDHAAYVYDAQTHRLTGIRNTAGATTMALTYDAQGNLSSRNGQAYEFDHGNRLRNIPGKEGYRYDGLGRRVLTSKANGSSTLWQYNQAGQLMFSWEGPASQRTHEFVYLGGSLVAVVDHDWPSNATLATRYQHTDALGSPVAVTSESGAVVARNSYEPYGAIIGQPSYSGVGYTGHVMDGGTGLTYMQQRYYDPSIGRLLSVDPVAADSGTGDNFNRYKYASNNPYRFVDPDGRLDKEAKQARSEQRRQEANARMAQRGSLLGRAGSSNAPTPGRSNQPARSGSAPGGEKKPAGEKKPGLIDRAINEIESRITPIVEVKAAYGAGVKYERELKTKTDRLGIVLLGVGADVSPGGVITQAKGAEVPIGQFNFRVGSIEWGERDAPVDIDLDLDVGKIGGRVRFDPGKGLEFSLTFDPLGEGLYGGAAVMFDDTLVPD